MLRNNFYNARITASADKVFQLKSFFEKIIILKLDIELKRLIVELKRFNIKKKVLIIELPGLLYFEIP